MSRHVLRKMNEESNRYEQISLFIDILIIMRFSMKKILIAACCGMLLSSCAWVKVTAKGEGVRLVRSMNAVESCKKLGTASTKVVSEIVFDRNPEKVAGELADLARNEAGLMGGDTIVPVSEIVDGRRVFGVYQCLQSKRGD